MGAPSEHSGIRHEIAPVTRFHDEFISDPQHTEVDDDAKHAGAAAHVEHDPESIMEAPASSRSSSEATCRSGESTLEGRAHLVPTITPFFHFDLTAAVRAAEKTVMGKGHTTTYPTFDDSDTKDSKDMVA